LGLRMLVQLIKGMMHKEIEVYVDNMIVKSISKDEHIVNLWKFLESSGNLSSN